MGNGWRPARNVFRPRQARLGLRQFVAQHRPLELLPPQNSSEAGASSAAWMASWRWRTLVSAVRSGRFRRSIGRRRRLCETDFRWPVFGCGQFLGRALRPPLFRVHGPGRLSGFPGWKRSWPRFRSWPFLQFVVIAQRDPGFQFVDQRPRLLQLLLKRRESYRASSGRHRSRFQLDPPDFPGEGMVMNTSFPGASGPVRKTIPRWRRRALDAPARRFHRSPREQRSRERATTAEKTGNAWMDRMHVHSLTFKTSSQSSRRIMRRTIRWASQTNPSMRKIAFSNRAGRMTTGKR